MRFTLVNNSMLFVKFNNLLDIFFSPLLNFSFKGLPRGCTHDTSNSFPK